MIVDVFMKSDMFSTSCLSLSAIQKKKKPITAKLWRRRLFLIDHRTWRAIWYYFR